MAYHNQPVSLNGEPQINTHNSVGVLRDLTLIKCRISLHHFAWRIITNRSRAAGTNFCLIWYFHLPYERVVLITVRYQW